MPVMLINPHSGKPLARSGNLLIDETGAVFEIVRDIPRIVKNEGYTKNFGFQWNKFSKVQLESEAEGFDISKRRFFAETLWPEHGLAGQDILEVGSGAGRFSKIILENTKANLYTIDFSEAVEANFNSNDCIAPGRFNIFQASIYELPFPPKSFDKVVCLGVLQHTPDFRSSVEALVDKAKCGGEIVVDFYPIKGWWTKIHAKYLLRPITRRLSNERLFSLINRNIDWLIYFEHTLHQLRLGFLSRFLPIVDIHGTLPKYLTDAEKREWALLDTFDMFSPRYDNPQRIRDVVTMFQQCGARVTFSGFVPFDGFEAAVVRAIRIK